MTPQLEVVMLLHYTPEDVARFWIKVNKTDTCWLWTAATLSCGYGSFGLNGRQHGAHRIAYTLTYGNIPEGMYICHACDVRNCVRPDHLWAGTQKDNIQDCIAKGRFAMMPGSHMPPACHLRGEEIYGSVATPDLVRAIRHRYAEGQTIIVHLAREFGVGRMVVRGIIEGSTWRHVD
jgi:hypothetical protein